MDRGTLILGGLLAVGLLVFSSNQLNRGWTASSSCGSVRNLVVDRQGVVWTRCVGDAKLYPDGGTPVSFSAKIDKSTSNSRSFAIDQNNQIWIVANDNRVLTRDVEGKWTTYTPVTADNNPMDIVVDGQGRAWVRSWNGLGMIDPASNITTYTLGDSANAITVDEQGQVWAEFGPFLKVLDADGNWITYASEAPGGRFPGTYILAIDKQGRVWASNGPDTAGVTVLGSDGEWTNYPLAGSYVTAIVSDDQGRVWVGSSSGLYVIDASGSSTTYAGTNSVQDLAIDGRGRLWIGGDSGVTILDPNTALSAQDSQLFTNLRTFAEISVVALGGVGLLALLSLWINRMPVPAPATETAPSETPRAQTPIPFWRNRKAKIKGLLVILALVGVSLVPVVPLLVLAPSAIVYFPQGLVFYLWLISRIFSGGDLNIGSFSWGESADALSALTWLTYLCLPFVIVVSNRKRMVRSLFAILVLLLILNVGGCYQVVTHMP